MEDLNRILSLIKDLSINKASTKEQSAIVIQSWWKGTKTRNRLRSLDDNMTYNIIKQELIRYNTNMIQIASINKMLSTKKIRNDNFPSHISENIAKFAIFKKYKIMPCWDTDKGDLVINKLSLFRRLEIKGFMSNGPSSFGPTEMWDWLYFVDACDTLNFNFKVYEIKLSNENDLFRNIKLSKNESYGDIASSKRRPRGGFKKVFQPQLGNKCSLIFQGHISELNECNN
jgi:hypothetical protein